jgi:predicted TPR repeat methyltransferase
MSHEDLVPQGVEERDAALLRRAYGLTGKDEGAQLYREWAATYDRTMVEGLGYISPGRLAALFASHVTWRDRPVLDLGCGTGLVAASLAELGFSTIDGLDLSSEMMAEAERRNIYRGFVTADLTKRLPIEDGTYAAAICNGTFTSGHVDASCLDEIVRVLAPGGVLACSVHLSVWDDFGFGAGFERLTSQGTLSMVATLETPHYTSSVANDGRMCVFSRT